MRKEQQTLERSLRANPDRGRSGKTRLVLLAWLIVLVQPSISRGAQYCEQAPPEALAAASPRGILVLIIDDLGHRRRTGMAMVELPGKVNLAILPHTPHAKELALAGFSAGKEIMLHAPMSNAGGTPVGPGGLTPLLARDEFDRTLADNIDAIPHVRGINNHMGSELTTLPLQMGWVMQTLLRRNLYFVDSRTNAETVAAKTAQDYSVPHLSRSVFLDNEISVDAITRQFSTLVSQAEREGVAVGIGHPYPQTALFLKQALPALKCRGIELALVSEVLQGSFKPLQDAGQAADDYQPGSEPDDNIPLGHVSLGLRHRVLPEVKNTGSEDCVGASQSNTFHQVVQVANTP